MDDSVRNLVEHFYDIEALSMSRNGTPKIHNKAITPIHAKSVITVIGAETLNRFGLLMESINNPHALVAKIADQAKNLLYNSAASSFQDVGLIQDFNVENFRFILDVKTDKEHLFNVALRRVSEVSISAFKKLLTPEKKNIFMSRPIPSVFSFDPFNIAPYRSVDVEGMLLTQFNLYRPPGWMESDKDGNHMIKPEDVKLPNIIHEFMEHIFPDPVVRNYVWGWMYFCLTSRCETYLVLNGKKGLGKGVLVEHLLCSLVGEDNFKVAPESFLTSDFNSSLDQGRLLYIDEQKVDSDSKVNKLKRYINKQQAIERKGVDADKVVDTYNSFIISNNSELDMKVEWDDRRFSVVDINKVSLRDAWGQDKIDGFIKLMRDPEVKKMFGYYVLYFAKQPGQDEFTVFKGEHFYRLAYVSLPEWQKIIVDTILSKREDEYDVRDIKSEFKIRTDGGVFPNKYERISSFLENYKHYGEDTLGAVEMREEGMVIVPSKKYRKSNNVSVSYDLI